LVKIAEAYTTGTGSAGAAGGASNGSASASAADDKTLSNTAREVIKICKSQI
jgi:hypothetical protein